MKKAERLIGLLKCLNNYGRLSLSDIAHKSRISQRTVYRDLRTLTNLGFPVCFENGHYLMHSAHHPIFDKLSQRELRLILFALKTHPFGSLFPLETLSKRISNSELFADRDDSNDFADDNILFLYTNSPSSKISISDSIISRFAQAVSDKMKVLVSLKPPARTKTLIPLALTIRDSNIVMLFSNADSESATEITLKQISLLEISDERFERRPVELLLSEFTHLT